MSNECRGAGAAGRLSATLLLAVALAAGAGAAGAAGRPDLVASALARGVEHRPGEVLVQFEAGAGVEAKGRALGRVGGSVAENVVAASHRPDGKGDLDLVRIPPGFDVATAVRALELEQSVEFAEPNWVYRHGAVASDTYYLNGSLWGMYGASDPVALPGEPVNRFGTHANSLWATTSCRGIAVGIIDEGVMIGHPDLAANIWTNPGEIAGNGIDDDGNGYVDDVNGYDFANDDATVYDGTIDDHGTHVAGTIGAIGNNGAGVAGMCWDVKMIPVKFLGRNGGTLSNAIKAVNYLTALKAKHGVNVVASNNSWGGGGFSQGLLDAISAAGGMNILFVAAAGNGGRDGVGDNNDVVATYPANYTRYAPNVIAVAAITRDGAKSSFSNFGPTTVHLGAPGSGIYSTLPGKFGPSYGSYSGTSMATPHVTGAVALYAALNWGASGITAAAIKSGILGNTEPTPSLAGITVTGGRLKVSGY